MSEAKEAGAEAQEYVKTITALKSALTILGGHNKGFLQLDGKGRETVQQIVSALVDSDMMEKLAATKPEDVLELQNLLTEVSTQGSHSTTSASLSFLQQPVYSSYSSQSGRIFGEHHLKI